MIFNKKAEPERMQKLEDAPEHSIFQRLIQRCEGEEIYGNISIKIEPDEGDIKIKCLDLTTQSIFYITRTNMVFVHDYNLNIETKIL